jgi:hypothetical protein
MEVAHVVEIGCTYVSLAQLLGIFDDSSAPEATIGRSLDPDTLQLQAGWPISINSHADQENPEI